MKDNGQCETSLLDSAMQLPATKVRAVFLAPACGDDAGLR